MKYLLIFLLVGLVAMSCETTSNVDDPADTHFIKFYGRDGDQTGRDLVVLPDGSMVLFGTSRPTVPSNGTQWYVVRVTPEGNIVWEQTYGGDNDEEARDIEIMSDGNLVLVGNSYKTPTDRDVMVLTLSVADGSKIDSTLVFTRVVSTVNSPSNGDEDASTITEILDPVYGNGFLIAGTTTYTGPTKATPVPPIPGLIDSHDALKIRLYSNLTTFPNTWSQIYGRYSDDSSVKLFQPATPLGPGPNYYYYSLGSSNVDAAVTTAGYNFWLSPLGADGDPTNDDAYTGTSNYEKMGSAVFGGSGYFMAGLQGTSSSDIYYALAFPDLDSGFRIRQEKILSLNLGNNLSGHLSVCAAPINGGFFILGEESGFSNNQNWFLTRVNNDGSKAMQTPIVFGGEGFDSVGAVAELPDGRVVIIGTMRTGRPDAGEYKMTLVKVNREGKFE